MQLNAGSTRPCKTLSTGLPAWAANPAEAMVNKPKQDAGEADETDMVACYERLFRTYFPLVLNVCLKRLQHHGDAEDATQETFARALGRPSVFAQPAPWLVRTATRVCLDELRRRRRRDVALGAFYTLAELPIFQDPAVNQANRVAMDELLASLTKAERRIIGCTVLADRSHVEAAAQLGISASTSRVLQSRALHKLRQMSLSQV
jgi:RNA polymerase sigma-70 factor (ECF subfamily)